MVGNKMLYCLPSLRTELNLVKNDEAFSLVKFFMIDKLKSQENVIQIRNVIKKIKDFFRCLSKINKDI